jgi:hypothetical protein
LPKNRLSRTCHETPMLLSAEPLLHTPCRNVLPTTHTGRPSYWLSARTAPPPRSGPVRSQRLPTNVVSTIFSWPPRSKIAPPPPPSKVWPVELPASSRRCWTTSVGCAWLSQWSVVQICRWSQVSWYRIRRLPRPLSVTSPPPSITTRRLVLTTFAVCRIPIPIGSGPQSKVITPPFATALTTFRPEQLPGVPLPITWSGWLVSTARPAFGTGTCATPRPPAPAPAAMGTAYDV